MALVRSSWSLRGGRRVLAVLGIVIGSCFGSSGLSAQVTLETVDSIPLAGSFPGATDTLLGFADMNGDGRDEVCVNNQGSLEIYQHSAGSFTLLSSVTLQQSSGGGFPFPPLPPGPAGGGVQLPVIFGFFGGQAAHAADFDGDLDLDWVIRSWSGYEIVLNDGAGGLSNGASYTETCDIGDVLVGDFNGDGHVDISTILPFGGGIIGGGMGVTFNTRFGDGSGTFGAVVMATAANVSAVSATVADLDENGRDDYVLSGIAELSFVFTDANGGVESTNTIPAGAGDAPQDFSVTDVNGDGHVDLVFTCPVLNRVGVMLLDGTGAPGPMADYVVTNSPMTVDAADIDGDGDADLIATTYTGIEWILGDGTGLFNGPSGVEAFPPTNGFLTAVVGDLDGDNVVEIAVSSGIDVTVYRNTSVSIEVEQFCRGDTTNDGRVNLGDGIKIINALFVSGSDPLVCEDSADANDDGILNVADAMRVFEFLFMNSGPIPAPGVAVCGSDPSDDPLDCAVSACP